MSGNKIIILAIFAMISTGLQLRAQEHHENLKAWPELNNFHEIIAATYHPAEEGNLKPLYQRSAELHEKAVKLKGSKSPDGINTAEVRKELDNLVQQTNELNEWIIKKVPEEDIKRQVAAVHTTFHKIMEIFEKREIKSVDENKK